MWRRERRHVPEFLHSSLRTSSSLGRHAYRPILAAVPLRHTPTLPLPHHHPQNHRTFASSSSGGIWAGLKEALGGHPNTHYAVAEETQPITEPTEPSLSPFAGHAPSAADLIPLQDDTSEEMHGLPLESIVKVFCISGTPNYVTPWSTSPSQEQSGSGFVIGGGEYILTNAHVVQNSLMIGVKQFGGTERLRAELVCIAHDCDLALLRVNDDAFRKKMKDFVIPFGTVPHLQDTVTVLGYPTGGENLSVTRGVISRVEPTLYRHGAASLLLAIQIDAAINPGNSGGPVLKNGKIVGVAFQSMSNTENINYIIPIPIIQHFLTDFHKHKRYVGFGMIGLSFQSLDNVQVRQFLGMHPDMTGIWILYVDKFSKAHGIVQADDVLLSIDGNKIALDGTIAFRRRERIAFDYLITQKFVGDSVRVELLRKGEVITRDVEISPTNRLVPIHAPPRYMMYGGLVFVPLTLPLLTAMNDPTRIHDSRMQQLFNFVMNDDREFEDHEIVILSAVYPDECNQGYQMFIKAVVHSCDGVRVRNLQQLKDLLWSSTQSHHRIDFTEDMLGTIILDRKLAMERTVAIAKAINMPALSSPDMWYEVERQTYSEAQPAYPFN